MKENLVPYFVRQGDYLTKLAHRMGFDEEEVWSHPKNQELAAQRPDREVLFPGDILFVPEPKENRLPLAQSTTNKYVATVRKVHVVVLFQEADGSPIANEPYTILGLPCAVEGPTTDS